MKPFTVLLIDDISSGSSSLEHIIFSSFLACEKDLPNNYVDMGSILCFLCEEER